MSEVKGHCERTYFVSPVSQNTSPPQDDFIMDLLAPYDHVTSRRYARHVTASVRPPRAAAYSPF